MTFSSDGHGMSNMGTEQNVTKNTIVEGEASESDEEESPKGLESAREQEKTDQRSSIIVAGEASESDEEESFVDAPSKPALPPLKVDQATRGDSVEFSDDSGARSPRSRSLSEKSDQLKYDTLLHKKLREKNGHLRSNLHDLLGQVYLSGAREMKNTTQQLMKCQASIQDVSHNMGLLTNQLFHLEDMIDIVATCNILPDVNIELPQNKTDSAAATPK